MLRDDTKRDLDRTFTRIETWDEFKKRWNAIDTEEEAIGLLHSGTIIPPFDYTVPILERDSEIEKRVDFYLLFAGHVNPKISTLCQQLIVKHWLKKLMPPGLAFYLGYFKAHKKILQFLGQTHNSLQEAPYPRFVAAYLLPLHEEWKHGSSPEYKNGQAHKHLRELTNLLINALCVWGLAYALEYDGDQDGVIAGIEQFLAQRQYDVNEALLHLWGSDKSPERLIDKDANLAAARTLLGIRYRFSPAH
ncbi:MAG: hypothetical protein WCT08_05895 [Patescibacteria group bacterium]|jgi:hypothetical protein